MYSPRHARPSCLPLRAVVGSSLTAVLLPLALATPALATEISPAPTTDQSGTQVGPWKQRPAAVAVPTSTATTSAVRTTAVAPQPVAPALVPTSLSLSAEPTGSDGRARLGVRVHTADGSAVAGEWVAIERQNLDGSWAYIGKFQTDGGSHALGYLPFNRDTRIRAGFSSTDRVQGSVSTEAVVTFVAPPSLGQRAVELASREVGKPYQWGATGPGSFDCSGLVTYVWKTQLGKSLPRTSSDMSRATQPVAQSAKQPGDLIFTSYNGRVSHVGIYAGDGKMWAAPTSGGYVKLQALYTADYTVGRVL